MSSYNKIIPSSSKNRIKYIPRPIKIGRERRKRESEVNILRNTNSQLPADPNFCKSVGHDNAVVDLLVPEIQIDAMAIHEPRTKATW